MPLGAYDPYLQYYPNPSQPFTPYGSGYGPFWGPASIGGKAVSASDMARVSDAVPRVPFSYGVGSPFLPGAGTPFLTGLGSPFPAARKRRIPRPMGNWESAWRRAAGAEAWNQFFQQNRQIGQDLSRIGLDSTPGWRQSLLVPAYRALAERQMASEVDIDRARQGWEKLRLMEKQLRLMKKKTGLGGLLGSLLGIGASLIPGVGEALAAALPALGWGAGSLFDYGN